MTQKHSHLLTGVEAIRTAAKTLPSAPGIYRMLDAKGDVLYIGKAKNLASRVISYANGKNANTRTLKMVARIAHVEVVVADGEAEALLMEAAEIKKLRPYYNILLKDDKSFPYLLLTADHPFPRITKHRGAQKIKGEYFGPFASIGALNQTLALLQKVFLIRPCSDTFFKNRTRPCLKYQIKRCSAPCVGYVSAQHYGEQVKRVRDFLHGKHRELQELLQQEMEKASLSTDYELAALLRDRIRALTQVQQEQSIYARGLHDADVIALAKIGAKSVVQVFFYRQGNHFGHQSFFPRHEAETTDGEVMAAFMAQFYQSHTPPNEILVNIAPDESELLAEALHLKAGRHVSISKPQRGDKLTLVTNAEANAQAALGRDEQKRSQVMVHLKQLQELFGLARIPERIEVYDNSHIMGSSALGAMIVATSEGFDKRSYRSFNMKEAAGDDDYAMMREVFKRRLKKGELPDLMLIDGGKGQLSAVTGVFKELGVGGVALVAIAKGENRNAGREWFFMEGRAPFQLPADDPLLHYLERLRDEAHRFVIGRHRNKRSKSLTVSVLDDIPGVGATRKRALLNHFGSRDAISAASLSELENVAGVSKKTAKAIYDHFHK